MNPRITNRDWGNIKGAMRRAFSRSELHKAVLERVTIEHSDPRNPRCTKWGYCELCGWVQPRWKLSVDHVEPVVALNSTFKDQGLDLTANRMWCELEKLQALCDPCHDQKTASEKEIKKAFKKAKAVAR